MWNSDLNIVCVTRNQTAAETVIQSAVSQASGKFCVVSEQN